MEIDRYEHGVPSWVDLSTDDLPKARAFYGSLFGWDTPEGPPEAGGYALAAIGGKPVAGLGPKMNPEAPTAWLTYVNVDDADAVIAKVGPAGGQVLLPPMDVMDVGRMGILADPAGAVIGIWQPAAHKGAGLVNEPNTYCWSELVTTDMDGAAAFYADVFGWAAETQGAEAGMAYSEWKVGGRSVGGMMAKPPEMPAEVPPYWGIYFAVEDADVAVTRIGELGGTVVMGPMDIEPGRFALAVDPGGAIFSVLALKAELAG
ncbi:MAG TPA: VOC family protein [Acidimicrobiales bacterium]|nr:VOC family protein [Acidimicrobiales bacterium]